MGSRIPLDNVCEKKIETLSSQYDGKIEYIDISSIDNLEKVISSTQIIDSKEAPSRARQLVKRGDILVSTVRPNLNAVAVIEKESDHVLVASTGYCVLRCNNEVDNHYIFHFCQSPYFINDMVKQATGASYPAVSNSIVRNCLVPLRNLEEQRHIATVLDKVSALISLRKRELAKLDELIKARFVEMFGDVVANPHGFMVSTLQSLINNGWITYHLDGNHGGDYPRSDEFTDEGVPYIGANCIANGKINFALAKHLPQEKANKLRKGIAQNGDVLFAHNATVGPVVILTTEEPTVILSTSLTAYRCNRNQISPYYLRSYMESDGFVNQYSSEMKQTTRNQVPITAQKKYLFMIPPIELQNQFSAFAEQTDESRLTIQQSLDKMDVLKKSLMQEYFGGTL